MSVDATRDRRVGAILHGRADRRSYRRNGLRFALIFAMGMMSAFYPTTSGAAEGLRRAEPTITIAAAGATDGAWRGTATTSQGRCSTFDVSITIKGGRISGKAKNGQTFSVSGSMTEGGLISGAFAEAGSTVAHLKGKLEGEVLAGTWSAPGSQGCRGKFRLKRLQ